MWYESARSYTDSMDSNSVMKAVGRHRIEHAQHLLGAQTVSRLSKQQAVTVVNPLHLLSDMHIMEDRLGKARSGANRAFAYHDMLQVEFLLCYGDPVC